MKYAKYILPMTLIAVSALIVLFGVSCNATRQHAAMDASDRSVTQAAVPGGVMNSQTSLLQSTSYDVDLHDRTIKDGTQGRSMSKLEGPTPKALTQAWADARSNIAKAKAIEDNDPAGAEDLYKQSVTLQWQMSSALDGMVRCEERLHGNAAAVLPYFRSALFDAKTGAATGNLSGGGWGFKVALLFEENGDIESAKKIYNSSAYDTDRILSGPGEESLYGFSQQASLPNPSPYLLPLMTDKSTASDVACYSHVGYELEHDGRTHEQRTHLEEALNIKDCETTRYFLARFSTDNGGDGRGWRKEMKNNPPSPEAKAKFDEIIQQYGPKVQAEKDRVTKRAHEYDAEVEAQQNARATHK